MSTTDEYPPAFQPAVKPIRPDNVLRQHPPATETHEPHPVDEPYASRVRQQITYHVGRLLDLVEQHDGGIPAGKWWDHAIAVSGTAPVEQTPTEAAASTTATIQIDEPATYPTHTIGDNQTAYESRSRAPQEPAPIVVDMDIGPIWRLVWALTACAITIAALLVLGVALTVIG